jgi:hypothetical protein
MSMADSGLQTPNWNATKSEFPRVSQSDGFFVQPKDYVYRSSPG